MWRNFSRCQLIFSWLGGKQQRAHPYAALLQKKKISRHVYLRWCGYIPEMSGRVAQFRSAQAWRVHRRDEALHRGRKQHRNPEKAGLKQRLNPFMWGLFLCCDWRMHVWTPTVSKCWFKGCKSAASKLKGFKNSSTSPPSSRQYESESDLFFFFFHFSRIQMSRPHLLRTLADVAFVGRWWKSHFYPARNISLVRLPAWAATHCVILTIFWVHSKLHCNKPGHDRKLAVCRLQDENANWMTALWCMWIDITHTRTHKNGRLVSWQRSQQQSHGEMVIPNFWHRQKPVKTCLTVRRRTTVFEPEGQRSPCFSRDGYFIWDGWKISVQTASHRVVETLWFPWVFNLLH